MDLLKAFTQPQLKSELPRPRGGRPPSACISRSRKEIAKESRYLRVPSSRKSTAASRKPLRCEGFYGVGVEKVFPVHSPHIAEIVTIRAAR